MSNLLIFSDLHAFKWREFAKEGFNGVNDRLLDCLRVLKEVRRIAEEEDVSDVLFAGDLLHQRRTLDVETYNLLHRALLDVAKDFPVHMIPGNHDQATLDGKVHSLEPFHDPKRGVNVYSIPCSGDVLKDKLRVGFFPYQHDPDKARQAFDDRRGRWDIAIVHAGFKGAKTGSFEYQPTEELEVGSLTAKSGKGPVFAGHYHLPQEIGPRLRYVGAPLQHTRGDAGQARGVLVYNPDDDSTLFEELTCFPTFETIIDDDIDKGGFSDRVKGNFVDVILTREPSGGLKAFRELLEQLEPRGLNLVYTPPKKEAARRLDVSPETDMREAVERYAKQFKPDELDLKKLTEVGKGFLP